ncbi:glycoside hydrolase family 73 protein [Weissella bombi]|uniref:Flagellum-specific peptidoglycan hydrolase FlgJ n=1 Tax=Weissella bombi TaxID=1505725 RepID=A0A1C4A1V0_9LACO|nr:glycoside hydrolase family 73 protein [Weissella bombi]SCB88674.1 Flagellum-specific peptidoglycan hydrolase FlgJ [Weissella bombi]
MIFVIIILAFGIWQTDIHWQKSKPTEEVPTVEMTHKAFIKKIAPEAQQLEQEYGILSSISIAQAALESNWGDSELSKKYNNFFGVKAVSGQPSVSLATKEYENNQWVTVDASFRVYDSWQTSMLDHAKLLVNGTTDNPQRYATVVQATDYKTAAKGLVSGGYATDPAYTEKIIQMIETYHLDKYDNK